MNVSTHCEQVLAIASVIQASSHASLPLSSRKDAYQTTLFLLLSGTNAPPGVIPSAYKIKCQTGPAYACNLGQEHAKGTSLIIEMNGHTNARCHSLCAQHVSMWIICVVLTAASNSEWRLCMRMHEAADLTPQSCRAKPARNLETSCRGR